MKNIERQFIDASKKLNWLINGLGQHGLKLSDCKNISWEWITQNYNVDRYGTNNNHIQER